MIDDTTRKVVATHLRSVAGDRTVEALRRERDRPAGRVRASCAKEMATTVW